MVCALLSFSPFRFPVRRASPAFLRFNEVQRAVIRNVQIIQYGLVVCHFRLVELNVHALRGDPLVLDEFGDGVQGVMEDIGVGTEDDPAGGVDRDPGRLQLDVVAVPPDAELEQLSLARLVVQHLVAPQHHGAEVLPRDGALVVVLLEDVVPDLLEVVLPGVDGQLQPVQRWEDDPEVDAVQLHVDPIAVLDAVVV
jgi:hypothetical protein